MAAAARRLTLKVPMAFISIVPTKASLSCGVPSRPTVRPPPTPPPATLTTTDSGPSALGGGDGRAHVGVVVDVAGGRDGQVTQLVGEGGGPVAVPVEDGHPTARLDEATDRRPAQPTGAAGDER